MTLFKQLQNNRSCIICNGKTIVFGIGGACEREDCGLLPEYTLGAIRVNIISVLKSNDYLEIALDYSDNTFRKFRVGNDITEVITGLQSGGGYSHILTRKGETGNIRFTQAFFVYPYDTDILDKIKSFKLEEVRQ